VVGVLLRMDAQIQQLTGRVEKLERELGRSSRNSSLPPSSDPPAVKRHKPARPEGPSGRSQGAQPGHEGKGRGLLETAACDQVVVHWPERCRCGHEFSDGDLVAVGELVRHQVQELPVISTVA
jgi:transposase